MPADAGTGLAHLATGFFCCDCKLMQHAIEELEAPPIMVQTSPVIELDDDSLLRFCQINRELRIERTADGKLIIMSPEGGSGGLGYVELYQVFVYWADQNGTSWGFGS